MSKKKFFLLIILLTFFSCKQQPSELSAEEKQSLLKTGDSITSVMQNVLMQNMSSAIQKEGLDYAVSFCNEKAIPLTDSISTENKIRISRISDKNRNPKNTINTIEDKTAWEKIKDEKKDLILQNNANEVFYYKPIIINMPNCLKCHGSNEDISKSTQNIIFEKYPDDKATGYEIGDLRGMWKIKF